MNTTANTTVEKFTPGPWHSENTDDGKTALIYQGKERIADVDLDHNQDGEANAKLIAAAPDLYAACKEFIRKVETGEARSTESYVQMKAAIKKATE